MFAPALLVDAAALLDEMRRQSLKLATAESCTGGLVAGVLTEIPESSDVLERGFIVYSNAAKVSILDVPQALLDTVGPVSREVAIAMAEGALRRSQAQVAVAVTGVAGPRAVPADKPVGLVHLAVACRSLPTMHQECNFGPLSRTAVRLASISMAIKLTRRAIGRAN